MRGCPLEGLVLVTGNMVQLTIPSLIQVSEESMIAPGPGVPCLQHSLLPSGVAKNRVNTDSIDLVLV